MWYVDVHMALVLKLPERPYWLTMSAAVAAASKVVDDLIRFKVFKPDERTQSISDIITACRFDPQVNYTEPSVRLDEYFYWGCNERMRRYLWRWDKAVESEMKKIVEVWADENSVLKEFNKGYRVTVEDGYNGTIWSVDTSIAAAYRVVIDGNPWPRKYSTSQRFRLSLFDRTKDIKSAANKNEFLLRVKRLQKRVKSNNK